MCVVELLHAAYMYMYNYKSSRKGISPVDCMYVGMQMYCK